MDRIAEIFAKCRAENRAALIIFAEAGYPGEAASEQAVEDAIASGADIIELGVPFSDPMADGPVICDASRAALESGMTLEKTIAMASRIRLRHKNTGLILFSYLNPLFRKGYEKVCAELKAAGADGILAVDLPLEERGELAVPCRKNGLSLIPLVSPETPAERMARIAASTDSGFLYYVSVSGTTGARSRIAPDAAGKLAALKRVSSLPVAYGFGVSSRETAAAAAMLADGVIAGSAFVRTQPDSANAGKQLVAELASGCRARPAGNGEVRV